MECKYCNSDCIRKGFQKNGKQKFRCTLCLKHQQQEYAYKAYFRPMNSQIKRLVQRGAGIRDIAYIKNISSTTVISRIRMIAGNITPPQHFPFGNDYEMDEMHTCLWENNKKSDIYISYAISNQTKKVLWYVIGKRDSITLDRVVSKVLLSYPKTIRTDRWCGYPGIIPKNIHISTPYKINHIERNHYTARTRLKRLSNNRLLQSKKTDMLDAYLKIYFWA